MPEAERLRDLFAGSSVGATEQAVLTAASAEGKTRIHNCAKEPEIIWLCRFLKRMGIKIQGEGTEKSWLKAAHR